MILDLRIPVYRQIGSVNCAQKDTLIPSHCKEEALRQIQPLSAVGDTRPEENRMHVDKLQLEVVRKDQNCVRTDCWGE